ncbi:fructose-specific PTS transporter subunit EIIC [Spiroplasma alleghenense]|uniref:PTS system, 2-O-A-mannosyl-D-glycerate-specific IIA component n=1 Tax=Spiroplasma alleghenense TaxID=216931 RepID=A0A345Z5A1_9MOLU|nr:fructose-specific PTS transporter subunit EIIC [Spiroplasma alleghenense]AXK51780.1 PTS system, 2-O-A-mannosyl-D-glycerate-specific IIA component [Spiroplasma alleghenense]
MSEINELLKPTTVVLNSLAKNKDEALQELAQLGFENKIVKNQEDLYKGFILRESETSTGLEDGFAIPHARIKEVKTPTIFFIKYSKPLEWETFDNKPVSVVIGLAIPKNKSSEIHLQLISKIATKLLNQKTRDSLKAANDFETVQNLLFSQDSEQEVVQDLKPDGYLIALTGCPAGVAHTYMSAKLIEDYAKSKNWAVKVEKQGANGIEDKLTDEDVQNANVMLIAADINPAEIERFKDLPVHKTSVAEPLHKMDEIWKKLMKVSRKVEKQEFQSKEKVEKQKFDFKTSFKRQSKGLKDAVLTGISYVVPVIVAGTTIVALITIIKQIFGADVIAQNANWLNTLESTAGGALSILLAPILAGYIAYAMADKPGLFPGFLGGLACNAVSYTKLVNGQEVTVVAGLGFLGGLIAGIIVGYMMIGAKKWMVSKKFQGVLTWFVYPILGSLIIMCLILFALGTPIAMLVSLIFDGLTKLQATSFSFVAGMLIGMLCVFDLGGPFNKVAWAFGFASFTGAFTDGQLTNPSLLTPYAAFWAAGIGTGWTTSLVALLGRKIVNEQEKEAGKIAWVMSSLGITEGSIPMMLSDPFRVIPGFVAGGAVSGALSYAFNLGSTITGGGFITVAGIQSVTGAMAVWLAIITFIIIALIGTAVSTSIILGLKVLKTKPETEKKVRYMTALIFSFGLIKLFKNKEPLIEESTSESKSIRNEV